MSIERVLLWGFMASGKSEVGSRLARRLGWEHIDFDEEIVRRDGRPIAEIFRSEGEAVFRRLEVDVSLSLLGRRDAVFSTGGGWVTNPELLEGIPPGTLPVWLRVSPETVLARVGAHLGGPVRPLLDTPDPAGTVRRLLAAREPLYGRADHAIATDDRPIESIAHEIEALVRGYRAGPAGHSPMQDA